jgi:hypothetical protein
MFQSPGLPFVVFYYAELYHYAAVLIIGSANHRSTIQHIRKIASALLLSQY